MATQSRAFEPDAFQHDAFQTLTFSDGFADGFATAGLVQLTGSAGGFAIVYAETRPISHLIGHVDGIASAFATMGQPITGFADGSANVFSVKTLRPGSAALLMGF